MATQSQGSGGHSIEQALAHAFAAFGPAYKRWAKTRLSEQHMNYTHARALHLLRCKGPQIMSGLGDDLGITPRYVTIVIDAMERDGLVRRRPHPKDRRATLIELTDAGQKMCGEIGDGHVEAAAELLRVLSLDQQQVLLEAMRTLLAELQRRGFCPDPDVLIDDLARQSPRTA
jgi:DNA-binding MarR family transcriptional regulator